MGQANGCCDWMGPVWLIQQVGGVREGTGNGHAVWGEQRVKGGSGIAEEGICEVEDSAGKGAHG